MIENPGTFTNRRAVQGFLGLLESKDRNNISTREIADKLEEYVGPVSDAFNTTYGSTEGGFGGFDGIRYAVASENEDDLRAAVLDLKEEIGTYEGVVVTFDNLESSASEIQFNMKPGAETLGITLQDVSLQVRQAFFGQEVQRLSLIHI